MSASATNETPDSIGRSANWLSWMLGAAILAAVIYAAVHVSEGRAFVAVAERAKPWWLVLAVCLQGATYLAQGEIFRRVPRAAGYHLPLTAAYELSLAKLFIDQALPSAAGRLRAYGRNEVREHRSLTRTRVLANHGREHRFGRHQHFLGVHDPLVGGLSLFNRAIRDPHHGQDDTDGALRGRAKAAATSPSFHR